MNCDLSFDRFQVYSFAKSVLARFALGMTGRFGEQLFALKGAGDSCLPDFSSRRPVFVITVAGSNLQKRFFWTLALSIIWARWGSVCCLWLWRTLLAELMHRTILALVCMQQRFSAHAFTFAWNCIFEGPVIKCLAALPSRSVNKLSTSSRWGGALDAFAGCVRSTFQVRLRLLGFSKWIQLWCVWGTFEVFAGCVWGTFEVRLRYVWGFGVAFSIIHFFVRKKPSFNLPSTVQAL